MAVSHSGHNHPATPAGRRACRAGNPTFNFETGVLDMGTPKVTKVRVTAANLGIDNGAGRIKAQPVRIQPRRSGARVSGAFASCVQAALHIDAHGGRCACGWGAKVAA
jgi:hypothetical protein